ncbi:DUF4184 family protein [Sanguibacter antarcticus]|uniref:Uncharacterized protein DUF4184 n=1 Tax=Sanguibacter antarcticus TaxID=372484 RepID=A0A2A9E8M7_9MICO|nr:DUF4184 family protein [Sanguibacter antarcticus]PFG35183.1 uncharacterized protein DUF4184 [Sanguibacter antarcticus]
MPYTPVHALVTLPFVRAAARGRVREPVRRWAVPALVAGSMVPDVPNFVDVVWPGAYRLGLVTHGLPAAFSLDVVLAVGFAALWVTVLGPAFLGALPRRSPAPPAATVQVRDAPRADPWREWVSGVVIVLGSALLGILSHLAWDDVTHRPGRTVQAWDVMREPFAGGRALYVYLQHGSSLLGMLLLVALVVWWWRRAVPVADPQGLRSAVVATLAGTAVGLVGAAVRLLSEPGGVYFYALARRSATYPVLGAALGLVAWAVVVRSRRRSQDAVPVDAG